MKLKCEILEDKKREREKKKLVRIYMLEKSYDTETNIRDLGADYRSVADFDLACL